jgi:hypothetical protein
MNKNFIEQFMDKFELQVNERFYLQRSSKRESPGFRHGECQVNLTSVVRFDKIKDVC